MISYYPPRLLPFLSWKTRKFPQSIRRLYYLSWEDAVWELLPQLGIKTGSTILLPDFYCIDVVNNMEEHGYEIKYYPLDHNLQISASEFLEYYQATKPEVVIIFHAAGITSQLSVNQTLIQKISKHSLIISDYVHRLVSPDELTFLSDRHLAIDSLRKNVPLPGSFAYLPAELAQVIMPPQLKNLGYAVGAMLQYLLYRTLLGLAMFIRSPRLVKYAHLTTLKSHDELVGDKQTGNAGLPWVPLIHRHLDLVKIKNLKEKQVQIYLNLLTSLLIYDPKMRMPKIKTEDLGKLHAFPLVILNPLSEQLKSKLGKLNVWAKFEDCLWSRDKKVFFLPLGFHITTVDQDQIIEIIRQTIQSR